VQGSLLKQGGEKDWKGNSHELRDGWRTRRMSLERLKYYCSTFLLPILIRKRRVCCGLGGGGGGYSDGRP
jgi:hypothetical protein